MNKMGAIRLIWTLANGEAQVSTDDIHKAAGTSSMVVANAVTQLTGRDCWVSGKLHSREGNVGAARLCSVCKHLVWRRQSIFMRQEVLPHCLSLILPADTGVHWLCSLQRFTFFSFLSPSGPWAPHAVGVASPASHFPQQTLTHSLVLPPSLLFSLHPFIFLLPSFPLRECVNCLALNTHVLPRLTASGGAGDMEEYIWWKKKGRQPAVFNWPSAEDRWVHPVRLASCLFSLI